MTASTVRLILLSTAFGLTVAARPDFSGEGGILDEVNLCLLGIQAAVSGAANQKDKENICYLDIAKA